MTSLLWELIYELLVARKSLRLRLRGGSMYPAICDNDIAYIQPVYPKAIRPGMIVLYMVDKRPIVHRILRQRESGGIREYLICPELARGGDWIPAENILGKVTAVERNGRIFSLQGWRGQLWGWVFSRMLHRTNQYRRALLTKFR